MRLAFTLILLLLVAATPTTLPSITHTLVLDAEKAGGRPTWFPLVLPSDWQTTGTAGERELRHDGKPSERVQLSIEHHPDGSVTFDLSPGAMDARYSVDLSRIDDSRYEGTWSSSSMFGPHGRPTSYTGKARLTAATRPVTGRD